MSSCRNHATPTIDHRICCMHRQLPRDEDRCWSRSSLGRSSKRSGPNGGGLEHRDKCRLGMQERCSAGLGAPTSWVRRDERRRTQGRVDPGTGAQTGPVPARSAAVLISGEVAGDSRADGSARPREELISWGWGARSYWLRLPVAYVGVAGVQHHGGSSRARKQTATTTLRPAGAPSPRSMVVVNAVGSNTAAIGSIPYRALLN
ncbi:hypothetical protein VPH35_065741 [Triticum aestivum]